MPRQKVPLPPNSSRADLVISWRLFGQNKRPLLATQGIAIISFLAVIVVGLGIVVAIWPSFAPLILPICLIPAFALLLAFQGSLYGLAFDIMSGGDQLTELGHTFRYLGRYFGRYLFFGLVLNFPTYLFAVLIFLAFSFNSSGFFAIYLCYIFGSLAWFCLFVQGGATMIARGTLKEVFHENFAILRQLPWRFAKTRLIFWSIFYFPEVITASIAFSNASLLTQFPPPIVVLLVLAVVAQFWYILVGLPMQALVATRIYNSNHPLQ